MAMSAAQLRRLAAAEDQGSVAAGVCGVNMLLLDFYHQNDKHAVTVEKTREAISSSNTCQSRVETTTRK